MASKSGGGGNLKEGLSSHEKIGSKNTTAKAGPTGRVAKRPLTSGGRVGKIKGRG